MPSRAVRMLSQLLPSAFSSVCLSLSLSLSLFRILFLIKGILSLVGSLFALLYAFFGMFMFAQIARHDQNMPFNPGIIFLIIGIVGFLFLVAIGVLDLMASKRLKEIRNHQFIFVTSILSCLTGILGIILGIFTLIELGKPEVKALFDKNKTN